MLTFCDIERSSILYVGRSNTKKSITVVCKRVMQLGARIMRRRKNVSGASGRLYTVRGSQPLFHGMLRFDIAF